MPSCYEHTALTELSPGATALGSSHATSAGATGGPQLTGICNSPELPAHIPGAKKEQHFSGWAILESHLPTPF